MTALVIGAGPAGLMAAEALSEAGKKVMIAEAKPSPARKFLMAGKSGLNLTKAETRTACLEAFGTASEHLRPMIEAFGPDEVMAWAEGLGQPLFTGSTARIFPKAMKASPLLRAWLARLQERGVSLRRNWRWKGWNMDGLRFETPDGPREVAAQATVLACGGASWARLGSDGAWAAFMPPGQIARFQPANMGVDVDWSAHMRPHFGTPLKGVALRAGDRLSRGEIVITATGLEGGGLYSLSPVLRSGADLVIDLCPDLSEDTVRHRLARPRGKASLANHLRKALKLGPAARAVLMEYARPLPEDAAPVIKALRIPVRGPRPLDEAISVAGGLSFEALDGTLMLRDRPGVFAAGEMLDWEAPTGGYLVTASLATGRWAGRAAADWISRNGASHGAGAYKPVS
ncbi:MAG: TIGR03862 family flavoprotein [Pseudomonadota bacterium]